MCFRLPALVLLAYALAPLVSVRNTGCRRGLSVLNAWSAMAKGSPTPARLRVRGFRCDFSGTDERLTLRCKRGRRVAIARWVG
ncbi:MAG TPA: hypothetical protein VES79_05865 [Solirubrobacteraceae bacterium]|nr:hypothetical protein [Solirubrobacteraceae bacterium]